MVDRECSTSKLIIFLYCLEIRISSDIVTKYVQKNQKLRISALDTVIGVFKVVINSKHAYPYWLMEEGQKFKHYTITVK